jgi:hypothetical protein
MPFRPLTLGAIGARTTALVLLAISTAGVTRGFATRAAQAARVAADTSFAGTVARLSEAQGYFDSDNLISNETSYLHAVTKLQRLGVGGGAYVGVGPDQNFSYIAAVRPTIAFIIDIRRDNLLLHLLLKALFERSRNRLEYLCRWTGRPVPADVAAWDDRPIEQIIARVDSLVPNDNVARVETEGILSTIGRYRVPLNGLDTATLRRFHGEFVRGGLDIRFTSANRAPRWYYPTLRQLILERDLEGGQANYLASRVRWDFIKALQERNRIIPVVGNLAGNRAFPSVGHEIAARGEELSALYVSNVEMYLWRDGAFEHFAKSTADYPRNRHSVIIRSVFGGAYGQNHPLQEPGYFSTQLVQPLEDFAERLRHGGWTSYWDVVTQGNR